MQNCTINQKVEQFGTEGVCSLFPQRVNEESENTTTYNPCNIQLRVLQSKYQLNEEWSSALTSVDLCFCTLFFGYYVTIVSYNLYLVVGFLEPLEFQYQ